ICTRRNADAGCKIYRADIGGEECSLNESIHRCAPLRTSAPVLRFSWLLCQDLFPSQRFPGTKTPVTASAMIFYILAVEIPDRDRRDLLWSVRSRLIARCHGRAFPCLLWE